MTTYYTVSGVPVAHSFGNSAYVRTEFTSIQTAFGTVNSEMITKANIASPTFTGVVTIPSGASIDGYALLASPAFTGVPTAPTATAGTGTTQIATCAFVGATAFSAVLPSQTGNSGKFVTTDGTNASWAYAGVATVTTATTATTLTSTPTLLQITPASYGVTVTLPDATTCSVGGPLHIIDNRGAYPVRVCDNAGTLKGFIFAGVVSHISLDDNSTAAGVWAIQNNELVGASAQLLTTNMALIDAVIDIGSSQEVIIGRGVSSANCYGVVYNRATNTFGSVTLIRTATFGGSLIAACLSGTNQVLVNSVATGTTSLEAVTLSISGTTITVNTAATATLSANISAFAGGCGLIAVGSSFVTSYTVGTPAAQIRALSISGTTVTIGSATVLDGTAGGLIAIGDSTHVIAASTATTHLYTKPYLVSGSSLTAGTGTDTSSGSMTLDKLAALGTRWYVGYNDGGSTVKGGVVSLNAAGNGTTTISTATLMAAATIQDAIVVSASKVLVLNADSSSNANILTDTAGTASAGTAITLSDATSRSCLYVNGTDVLVAEGTATGAKRHIAILSCSGASATRTKMTRAWADTSGGLVSQWSLYTSNAVLNKSASLITSSQFAQCVGNSGGTFFPRVLQDIFAIGSTITQASSGLQGHIPYIGKADSERWLADAATVITKLECVV